MAKKHSGITQARFEAIIDHMRSAYQLGNDVGQIAIGPIGAKCLEQAGATFELVDGHKVYSATDAQLGAARKLMEEHGISPENFRKRAKRPSPFDKLFDQTERSSEDGKR